MAHVTGGGIDGNTGRILADGLASDLNWGSWPEPAVFDLIRTLGSVPEDDMRKTFNLGIGLVVIVEPQSVDTALNVLSQSGHRAYEIGCIISP